MNQAMNPIEIANELRETYLRYLETSFYLKNPSLQKQFCKLLQDKSQPPLVREPILEITPSFVAGKTLPELVEDNVLSKAFSKVNFHHLMSKKDEGSWENWWQRPLYQHQEIALRKAISEQKNLVIATGTGSGKTECFMYPVINQLLKEKENGTIRKPGVRALFLYPMNALANDQISRLRELLAGHTDITFGRYTGETKQHKDEAEALYRSYHDGDDPLPNELTCRDQMREAPPHILFTNYAMLEYLMIRPNDSRLFEGGNWRFIVLDEVHTYSGALGVEISMLLRRLKERVCESEIGKLQCIGTSATLGEGKKDYPRIAKFASDLFGEYFSSEDVIGATHETLDTESASWGNCPAELYQKLREYLFSENEVSLDELITIVEPYAPYNIIQEAIVKAEQVDDQKSRCQIFLHNFLLGDEYVQKLRSILQQELAIEISKVSEKIAGLTDLVAVGSFARRQGAANPLIPARYHIMARAISGIFSSYDEAGNLHLIGRRAKKHNGRAVFEVASCNRCGEIMLVGEKIEGYLEQPPGVGDSPISKNLVWLSLNKDKLLQEQDEDNLTEEDNKFSAMTEPPSPVRMCAVCGRIEDASIFNKGHCDDHSPQIVELYELQQKNKWSVPRQCPSCLNNHGSVASRVLTGKEVPVAVIATALY